MNAAHARLGDAAQGALGCREIQRDTDKERQREREKREREKREEREREGSREREKVGSLSSVVCKQTFYGMIDVHTDTQKAGGGRPTGRYIDNVSCPVVI